MQSVESLETQFAELFFQLRARLCRIGTRYIGIYATRGAHTDRGNLGFVPSAANNPTYSRGKVATPLRQQYIIKTVSNNNKIQYTNI